MDRVSNDTLSVVYSTDDNYAQHTGVSIVSLLENNKHFSNIVVYIIDNDLSKDNKDKLISIADEYNRKLEFREFKSYIGQLSLKMEWKISISAYARLFIAEMLPKNINKILYFDCDTIIEDGLDEIWNVNIKNYSIAGVEDTVSRSMKELIGMNFNDKYINSGMLLINLKKWREENITNRFLSFIDTYKGNVVHHDQGIINGTLKDSIKILPLKFNVMTVFYTMKIEEIIQYYNLMGEFYSEKEISEAINKPVYVHFTPGFVGRPWVRGCKHPQRRLYWGYLEKTPWKNFKAIKDKSPIRVKIVNWIYRNIPFNISNFILKNLCTK